MAEKGKASARQNIGFYYRDSRIIWIGEVHVEQVDVEQVDVEQWRCNVDERGVDPCKFSPFDFPLLALCDLNQTGSGKSDIAIII